MEGREIVRQFTHTPSLILTYCAFAGNMFLTAAYLSWLPTYFHRTEHLSMEKAGIKGSLVMMLAIAGFPIGGYLADKWREKNIRARLLFPAVSSIVTGGLFFISFFCIQGVLQYGVILTAGIAASAFSPPAICDPGCRSSRSAGDIIQLFCVIFQNLLGSSLGPRSSACSQTATTSIPP